MKTIQYQCPYCRSEQTHEECSLYSTLECSECEQLFRLADAIHFYGTLWPVKAWWTRAFGTVGTRGLHTGCIFCHEPMPMQICTNGSFAVPDFCPFCTQELPHSVEVEDESDEDEAPPAPAAPAAPVVPAPAVPVPVPAVPVPAVPVPAVPVPAPVPVPVPPSTDPLLAQAKKATNVAFCKAAYQQAVEDNGGVALSDEQFAELLEKLKAKA